MFASYIIFIFSPCFIASLTSHAAVAKYATGYVPHPNTINRSADEVAKYREENTIAVSETDAVYNPILSFEETNVPEDLRG